MVVLAGYAILNKGFAYLNLANILFVGEFALTTGILIVAANYTIPTKRITLHALVMFYFLIGTSIFLLSISKYGIEAVRDYAMVYYSLFFFLSYYLSFNLNDNLLEKFFYKLTIVLPIYFLVINLVNKIIPGLNELIIVPGTTTPLFFIKMGDLGVWLSSIIAFFFLFNTEFSFSKKLLISVATLFVFFQVFAINRGGALSLLIGLLLITSRYFSIKGVFYGAVGVFILLLFIFSVDIKLGKGTTVEDQEHREFSTMQMRKNIESLFVPSQKAKGDLGGTKEWRLLMWAAITNDLMNNSTLFYKGYGLGPSLLQIYDEFEITEAEEGKTTKHPHNFIINVFARMGVFGLISFALIILFIIYSIFNFHTIPTKLANNKEVKILAVILVFLIASFLNSNFDIYLEGPMGAIPFWCMLGFANAQQRKISRLVLNKRVLAIQ